MKKKIDAHDGDFWTEMAVRDLVPTFLLR